MRWQLLKRLFVLSVLAGLLACAAVQTVTAAAPDVFILHDPIQPSQNQQVTFTATATPATGDTITSIRILEERYTLSLCGGQVCSTLVSGDVLIKDCTPPSSNTCAVTVASYPNLSYIGYKAVATTAQGGSGNDGYIYFAVGSYPKPDDPIPVYVRGNPSAPASKIDLVFIPDNDYGASGWQDGFMRDITALIKTSYLSSNPVSQQIRPYRAAWNFYITYLQGDAGQNCSFGFPSNWTALSASMNAAGIVHKTDFQDCTNRNLNPRVFSIEPTSFASAIHETGHAVFNLADEYVGGDNFQDPVTPNVHDGKASCQSYATLHGWDPKKCTALAGGSRWFRSDGGNGAWHDLMRQPTVVNDRFDLCDQMAVEAKYQTCNGNGC